MPWKRTAWTSGRSIQSSRIRSLISQRRYTAERLPTQPGKKFTTVVQIGIGGSDLGPRAMYLALENWAKKNGLFKMEAKFISNVDPDDAAAVLASTDVAHAVFILVSKSGTTLETLTNESFVKDALKKRGTGSVQTYGCRYQRDLASGQERRLSCGLLYGRLHWRTVFFHFCCGRSRSFPGVRAGSVRAVPGRSRGCGSDGCEERHLAESLPCWTP